MSLLNRNAYRGDPAVIEEFPGTTEDIFWSKWVSGFFLSVLVAIYGIHCCVVQNAFLPGRRGHRIELTGDEAVALGLAWISIALFLHFHCFWGTLLRFGVLSAIGKALSAIGFICSLGYVFWSIASGWWWILK